MTPLSLSHLYPVHQEIKLTQSSKSVQSDQFSPLSFPPGLIQTLISCLRLTQSSLLLLVNLQCSQTNTAIPVRLSKWQADHISPLPNNPSLAPQSLKAKELTMANNSQSPRDLSTCYLSKLISHYLPQLTVSILSLLLLEPNKHIPALGTSALQVSLLVQMRNLGHRIQRSKVVQMPILRGIDALNFETSYLPHPVLALCMFHN